jgi:putative spermidine/putrescine transport system substrate-binding protein
VWQHTFLVWDELAAVKGSKSPEAQQAFLSFVAQPEQQAEFAKTLPYGPTTQDTELDLPQTFLDYMPQGHEDEIETPGLYDAEFYSDKKKTDEVFSAWTEMTAG